MPVTVGPGQIDLSVSMATTTQTSGWSISYQLVFCGGPRLTLYISFSFTLVLLRSLSECCVSLVACLLPSLSFPASLLSVDVARLSRSVTHQAFTNRFPLSRTLTCSPESLPPSLRSSLGSLSHRNPRFSSFSAGFSKGKDEA